jgi:PAS domain S-box-containing protein
MPRPLSLLLVHCDPDLGRRCTVWLHAAVSPGALHLVSGVDEAVAHLAEHDCDAVLLPLDDPALGGVAAVARIKETHPYLPVLALCPGPDEPLAMAALRAGAEDCIVTAAAEAAAVERAIRYGVERQRARPQLQPDHDLQGLHRRHSQLLASLTSIIIGVDTADRVTYWNHAAERVLERRAEAVRGQSLLELGLTWDWERLPQHIAEASLEDRASPVFDLHYRCHNGDTLVLAMIASPLHAEGDQEAGFLLSGEDVTERRRTESQVQQARRLQSIGQLAAGIAHEINTPVQYVGDNTRFLDDACKGLLGLLEPLQRLIAAAQAGWVAPDLAAAAAQALVQCDAEFLRDEVPAAVQQTLEGVDRVASIVRAMKDFARPGGEEKVPMDINRAVTSTVTVARNEWKYVAELVTDLDPDLPSVPGLPGPFNEVVLNLIVNAADAVTEAQRGRGGGKGHIWIQTRREGDWAVMRVRDDGIGMSEAVRACIFDPFFTTKEVGGGTGQGLAISHAIVVERHGGRIEVESSPGQGSTFTVSLPLEAPA